MRRRDFVLGGLAAIGAAILTPVVTLAGVAAKRREKAEKLRRYRALMAEAKQCISKATKGYIFEPGVYWCLENPPRKVRYWNRPLYQEEVELIYEVEKEMF